MSIINLLINLWCEGGGSKGGSSEGDSSEGGGGEGSSSEGDGSEGGGGEDNMVDCTEYRAAL